MINLIIIALNPNSRDGFWTNLDFKLWERIYWRHSKSKSGQGGNVGNRDESLGGSRMKKNRASNCSILQYSSDYEFKIRLHIVLRIKHSFVICIEIENE